MLYKKTENLEGKYEDISGQRFDLLVCNEAFGPQARTFLPLADLAAALDNFSLEEV